MVLEIHPDLLLEIQAYCELLFPEEACGILLGSNSEGCDRSMNNRIIVRDLVKITNISAEGTRHNRYMLSPQEYLSAELLAEQCGLQVIGVFHSHPDHSTTPSEIDLKSVIPGFVYLINGLDLTASETNKLPDYNLPDKTKPAYNLRAWQLSENHNYFIEEQIYENSE